MFCPSPHAKVGIFIILTCCVLYAEPLQGIGCVFSGRESRTPTVDKFFISVGHYSMIFLFRAFWHFCIFLDKQKHGNATVNFHDNIIRDSGYIPCRLLYIICGGHIFHFVFGILPVLGVALYTSK